MTHRQQRRINERHALALPLTGLQIGAEGNQRFLPHLHKTAVAHESRKGPVQMRVHVAQKIIFERALPRLMKTNRDRHHFAQTQLTCPDALSLPPPKQSLLPARFKLLTEVVNVTEQRYNFHTRTSLARRCWLHSLPY